MDNQVAAECCGSCKWDSHGRDCPKYNCIRNDGDVDEYVPNNPIPVIELSGVKELIKAAWIEGWNKALEGKDG